MNKVHKNGRPSLPTTLAAGLMLAMAFTLSACGGDGGGGGGDEAGSLSSSSSGGGSLSYSSSGSGSSSSGTSSSSSNGDTPSSSSQPPPKCGGTEYNPDKYECRNGSKIYLKSGLEDSRDGNTYDAVLIGTQVWMAENLNFNADGSKCGSTPSGSGTLSDANTIACDKYGRLYDWATAMGLEASCNSSDCSSQIQPKHQGVCPSGWHIPSGAEWQALVDFAGGDGTAGTKLKSTSGWNAHATYGDGTDDHGFSALPGGYGNSDGNFYNVGNDGYWWGASEYGGSNAYSRYMYYSNENAGWFGNYKSSLFSVRCLQD
ncbi:MAG: fibrobacter succinogenes major paralogous domain-containing protein [Fibromonadaceae bacterium]|jgi:uncharacterized protein (TIGR02145 family)|nr:fibrobacter succinogenes major paralogous domain-containing protein [Fibromonadaceae bacterium]